MRFFHFKAHALPVEAHVFAETTRRAAELFFLYAMVKGHRTEDFMWRELAPDNFEEPDQSRLRKALLLNLDGIAPSDDERGWVPLPTMVPDFDELDELDR